MLRIQKHYQPVTYKALKAELARQGYQRNGREFLLIDDERIPCHVYSRDIANTLKITVFANPWSGIVDGKTEWNEKRLRQILKEIGDYNAKYHKRTMAEERLPADAQMERIKINGRTFIDYPGLPPHPTLSKDAASLLAALTVPDVFSGGDGMAWFGLQKRDVTIRDLNPISFFSTVFVMPGLDEANKSLSSLLLRLGKQVSCQYAYLPGRRKGRPIGAHPKTAQARREAKRLLTELETENKHYKWDLKKPQLIKRVAEIRQRSPRTITDWIYRNP